MSSDDLRAVMDLDRWIDRLEAQRANLPERTELAVLEGDLRAHLARLREVEAMAGPLREAHAQAAATSSRLRERRDQLSGRLEASRNAREGAALSHELEQVTHTLAEAEDVELDALIALEPVDTELERVRREAQPLAEARANLREVLAGLEASTDEEIAAQRESRPGALAALDPALRARYEAARTRAGTSGAAQVIEGRCDGCRIALSPLDLDRWRHTPDGEFVECPSCGRLLLGPAT